MDDLFPQDSSFTQISLSRLARCFLGEGEETIGIAGFQRNAVWKENKVEDLWDSILCQFPIGSLMFARYDAFSDVGSRKPQLTRSGQVPVTQFNGQGTDYIVVDGQQRLNAIALGFMPHVPGDSARLWVDMSPPLEPNRRQFDFHLCTRENPFGIGLSPEQRRQAFDKIGKDETSESIDLDDTFPFRGRLAIPFFEFCNYLRQPNALISVQSVIDTITLNDPARNRLSQGLQKTPSPQQLNHLTQAIRELIHEGKYLVPVTQIKKTGDWMNAQKLGLLFERVNINGEVPPQSELFFSALKLRYPPINNYVAEIHNSSPIERLLSPTDLIFIALRMVDPSITVLQIARFEKIAKDKGDELVHLLEKQGGNHSLFGQCIQLAYEALHFNGEDGDIGLPRQYLARLRPRVWQTIVLWLMRNQEQIGKHGLEDQDRLEFLRFAVLDTHNYFLDWRRGFSTYITSPTFMSVLSDALVPGSKFLASNLLAVTWKKARADGYTYQLISPTTFRKKIQTGELVANWFALPNEDFLLLYAQRQILAKWEKQRLDIDHIVPSVWMYFTGYHWKKVWLLDKKLLDYRGRVLNCSGNKRFWPESLNRAYRNIPPGDKYIHNRPDKIENDLHLRFHLTTIKDVLTASVVDPDQAEGWSSLKSNHAKIWDVGRFSLFKKLTDERRYRIYKLLYDTLKLDDLQRLQTLPEDYP